MQIAFIRDFKVPWPFSHISYVIYAYCSASVIFKSFFPFDLSLHELNVIAITFVITSVL